MRHVLKLVFSLTLLLSLAVPGTPVLPGAAAQMNPSSSLQPHQGRYFRWTCPPGWRVSESNSGLTLTSPDGRYNASLVSLLRSRGSATPEGFLRWLFGRVPSYRNVRVLGVSNLPSRRVAYQVWQFIEARVSYTDNGLPVTGVYKVGVANYGGMNDAMIVGYRAANPVFHDARSFMPQIAKSIVLTNGAEANGNNTLIRPKNNPLDNSGLIQAGKNRDRAREHASEAWREGMMGTEPTIDSKTGKQRNTPLGDYNAARGGYVNPDRPGELLTPNHK
jgi:hypothetical protein